MHTHNGVYTTTQPVGHSEPSTNTSEPTPPLASFTVPVQEVVTLLPVNIQKS